MPKVDGMEVLRQMKSDPRLKMIPGVLVLALFLLPAGIPEVKKYVGFAGVWLYLVVGVTILLACRWRLMPAVINRVTEAYATVLALVTLGSLLVVFVAVFPLADSGAFGGGSDSDDALNLGARALLRGEYPYDSRTYLGAPITYFPGALLLATPFVILGNAAYQNVFWMAAFLVAARIYLNDTRQALVLFWTTLLCARIPQALVTGSEILASSIYIVLFVMFAMRSLRSAQPQSVRCLSAVLLGVGLSSRANYLLLVPVILSATVQRVGWRATMRYAAVTLGTALAVTLPFWLHAPQTFLVACIKEQNFVAVSLASVFPHADIGLPAASVVFAVGLSLRRLKHWGSDLLLNCALTQAFPILAITLLASVDSGTLNVGYAGYGLHALFFGVLASWSRFAGAERRTMQPGACTTGLWISTSGES
jgi:hypothetical protein